MFLRKRSDAFKDKHEHLEVGDHGRQNIIKERECEMKIYKILGVLGIILILFLVYMRHVWNAETELVFGKMQDMAQKQNLLCVSSHHVGATDRNWIILNDGTRVVNLRLLSHGKSEIMSKEVFTHCTPPLHKSVRRYKHIDVAYESESFFHVIYTQFHHDSWSDESALCAQHMLDIFEGKMRCPLK